MTKISGLKKEHADALNQACLCAAGRLPAFSCRTVNTPQSCFSRLSQSVSSLCCSPNQNKLGNMALMGAQSVYTFQTMAPTHQRDRRMAATLIYVLFLFSLADFKMHFRGRFAPVGSHCRVSGRKQTFSWETMLINAKDHHCD